MFPCPTLDVLRQALSGALDDATTTAVAGHVEGCADCRARLDGDTQDTILGHLARPPLPSGPGLARLLEQKTLSPPADAITPLTLLGPPRCEGDLGTLGPYRVLGEIGRGGMGIVFCGLDEALQRPVAIKVLRPELAGEATRGRLLREAQAVARFRHDHAVQVYAVGSTEQGLPYLVMEHLEGPTLARLVSVAPRPTPRAAAQIAGQVAAALAAAHAVGLVHRDVKPANVLLENATGRARILDFGLARLAENAQPLTREGALAGTPSYMSPEQVRGGAVDGRSDIYGLGVTLYEVLTGEPPFRGSPARVLHQVLHDEPRPPRQLDDTVPRDLETICLKAMAKEPGGRYPTAQAMAEDLTAFLDGRPIRARRIGALGRLVRACRRRPLVASLLTALLLSISGGTAGVLYHWHEALAQRDDSDAQRRKALEALRRERLAVDRYFTEVSEGPELKARSLEPLRRRLLQSARDEYERFVAEHPDDPELQAELGRAHGRLGLVVALLDSQPHAQPYYEKARTIFERLLENHPDDPALRSELALAHHRLAEAHAAAGEHAVALEHLRQARGLWEGLLRERPEDGEVLLRLLHTLNNLGRIYQFSRKNNPEAQEALQAGRDAYTRWTQDHAAQARHQDAVAWLLTNLGALHRLMGRPELAGPVLDEAFAIADRLVKDTPGVDFYKETLNHAANEKGIWHAQRGEATAAEAAWKRAEAVTEELVHNHPAADDYQARLAIIDHNLGLLALGSNRPADAERYLRKALAVHQRLVRERPGVVAYLAGLDGIATTLRWLLLQTNQLSALVEMYDALLRGLAAVRPSQEHADMRHWISKYYTERADVLLLMRRYGDARASYDQALSLAPSEGKQRLGLQRTVAVALDRTTQGDHEYAAARMKEVVAGAATDGHLLFLATVTLSLCARAANNDARLSPDQRRQIADEYAALAMRALGHARAAGYFGDSAARALLETDDRLAILRPRDDFKQLQAAVRPAPATAKP